MPRKIELTWHSARKCWKKYHKGKTHYLAKGRCKGKTDWEGYQLAWAEWQAIKAELDGYMQRPNPQGRPGGQVNGNGNGRAATIDLNTAAAFATDYDKVEFSPKVIRDVSTPDTTIAGALSRFIQQEKQRAETGLISLKMYRQYRDKLEDFGKYAAFRERKEIGELDAGLLDEYKAVQNHLMGRDDKHAISPYTAKKRLDGVVRFLNWLYEREWIDRLPRNVNRSYARVAFPKPVPRFFTVEEIRAVFNAATPRTRLYVALALNCGYTQIDIATLEHGMIDWPGRAIRRKRHKTDIPQEHRLWPVTVDLLKAEMTDAETGLVLLDEKGQPLYRERFKGEDEITINDVIRLAFERTIRKVKLADAGKSFKLLRKTSANEIERQYSEYPHLSSQFLAHAETATKRYYVASHYDRLFEAIDYLDSLFALRI